MSAPDAAGACGEPTLSTAPLSCDFCRTRRLFFAHTFDRKGRRWVAVSSWVSVLQQLAELDPDEFDPADLSDEQLRETVPLAQRGINRLTSVMTRAVAAGDA